MNFPNYLLFQQVRYDQEADAMYIQLTTNNIVDTDMIQPHVIVDYDDQGEMVWVEILSASKHDDYIKTILFSGINSNNSWASSSLSISSKGTKKDSIPLS